MASRSTPRECCRAGEKFDGVEGLRETLKSKKDQFARCFAEKMLTYALGRGLEDFDDAAVDQIAHAAAQNDFRFSSFAIEIARSAPFQMRREGEREIRLLEAEFYWGFAITLLRNCNH